MISGREKKNSSKRGFFQLPPISDRQHSAFHFFFPAEVDYESVFFNEHLVENVFGGLFVHST
jgi:hypothetical protein